MIRSVLAAIITLAITAAFFVVPCHAIDVTLDNARAQLYFSPNGGATKAIVRAIDGATLEVLVQAYSFTSPDIAKALIRAKGRGVSVEAVLDKSQQHREIHRRHVPRQ